MKRIACVSLIALSAIFILVACFAVSNVPAFADGEISISSAEDFIALSEDVASSLNKTYILTADVDLSASAFSPIGTNVNPFNGTFDGQGHSVTLDVDAEDYGGLFGVTGTFATVKDLTVKGRVKGEAHSAGVVGSNSGAIRRCVNEANVIRTGSSTVGNFGGIVGINTGTVSECVNVGDIEANRFVGGIAGSSTGRNADISSCVNFGSVTATDHSIGGLVGDNAGHIADNYASAEINAPSSAYKVGSAIGYLSGLVGEGSAGVYAVSAIDAVGEAAIAYPDTFATITSYRLLYNDVFSDDTLVHIAYDEGYGYLPCPAFVETNAIKSAFKILLFDSGDGTSADPFIVDTIEEYRLFARNTYIHDYTGKYVKLTRSLNIDDEVIGSADLPFNGSFDGDGHAISYSLSGADNVGLFVSCGSDSVISDLTVNADVVASGNYAGILAGRTAGAISDVEVNGSVSGNEYVGGVVGASTGDFTSVVNNASVSGVRYVGGIAGSGSGITATGLVNYGDIALARGNSYAYFGGVFGSADGAASYLCSQGGLNVYRADYVGGIAGSFVGDVNGAAVTSDVYGRNYVGGIFGSYFSVLTDFMVYCDVFGAQNVGGVIGYGTPTTDYGYFSGRMDGVAEATVDKTTFRTIAPAGATVQHSYYNSNKIYSGTDGEGKSDVQLTENLFSRPDWECKAGSLSSGYYPIISVGGIIDDIPYYFFDGGAGTEQSPFLLASEVSFRNFLYLIDTKAATYGSLYYAQSANIIFTRELFGADAFGGKFDGNGYTLNELSISEELIGTLTENGEINNLGIESGSSSASLIGSNYGAIRRSYSLADVTSDGKAGGFVTDNFGTITECIYAGDVEGTVIGGIAGENKAAGSIVGCSVKALAAGSASVGGIAGKNCGSVTGAMVAGTYNLTDDGGYMGGLAGEDDGGRYSDSIILGVFIVESAAFDDTVTVGCICGFANRLSEPVITGTVVYNSDYTAFTRTYTTANEALHTTMDYARNTSAIKTTIFESYEFVTDLYSGRNSDYAPRQSAYTLEEDRLNDLSAECAMLPVFGWDHFSHHAWGSENNPYLISTASQLRQFRDLSLDYDYSGEYFRLTADISMNGVIMHPIGKYVGAGSYDNSVFNGTFDGNWHTVDYVNINESSYGYVGLFAYTGRDAVIRNLILGAHSSIRSSADYVGGLVGYNCGTITDCVCYAEVDGTANIGGIAAISDTGTTISNVVFNGVIDESKDRAYGISSQKDDVPRFTATNVWYVRNNPDGNTFVKSGSEGYIHNVYGSVLYVDRGGSVEINVTGNKFYFLLRPSVSEPVGKIMHGSDGVIYTKTNEDIVGFDPLSDDNIGAGASVKYFARFTSRLYADFTGVSADRLQTATYGEGYYYQGQNVTLSFNVKNGYFIADNAVYSLPALNVSYANDNASDGTVILKMTLTKPAGEYGLPVSIEDFAEYGIFTVNDLAYNAQNKIVSIDYAAGKESLFGAPDYLYYMGITQVTALNAAGDYTIRVRLRLAGHEQYFGALSVSETITRAVLAPTDDASYWTTFTSKVYDNAVTALKAVDLTAISGVFAADENKLVVTATINWSTKNAGSVTADVTGFALSGAAAANYSISGTVAGINATITPKAVTYTIQPSALTGSYTGSKPAIVGSLSSSIYGASYNINCQKLLDDGETVDTAWTGDVWNVGVYALSITCSDPDNVTLELAGEYKYTITKRMISEMSYSGNENLVYSGSEQSIRAEFVTVNMGIERAGLTYYIKDDEGEYVFAGDHYAASALLDAGYYVAVPQIPAASNYALSAEINLCYFSVSKNSSAGNILIGDMTGASVDIGERIELPIISDVFDATLQVVPSGNTRARAHIEVEDDKFFFVPTAYSASGTMTFSLMASGSKNYTDRSSEELTITIVAGSLYVALREESRSLVYGDVPSLDLIYSFDDTFDSLINPTTLGGFVAPECEMDGVVHNAGHTYTVTVYGGVSDGYKLRKVEELSRVTVAKRSITVRVSANSGNGKIYGEEDEEIAYGVVESGVTVTTLPDGRPLELNGKLSREEGEDAGRYDINAGTLTAGNNPNYDVTMEILADYVISKRNIRLVIDHITKSYGVDDPEITYSPAADTPYVNGDGKDSVYVDVTREPGENVGTYQYFVESSNGLNNYNILQVDYRTNTFVITRARPSVNSAASGSIRYGDAIGRVDVVGSAFSNNRTVAGRLSWADPSFVPDGAGPTVAEAVFTPDSDNFETVGVLTEINVLPRKANVGFEGNFEYEYNGQNQCNITARVLNAVGDDNVKLVTSIVGVPKDAGKYVFRAELDESETDYELDGYAEAEFFIYGKIVVVKVEDANVGEGETYVPSIVYDGFIEGESQKVLTKKATVEDIPDVSGIYYLKASGAEAKNYRFVYESGKVVINKSSVRYTGEDAAKGELLEIKGEIPATMAIEVKYYDSGSNLIYRQEQVDKGLKHNIFYPNLYELKDYCDISYTDAVEGELQYTASVNYTEGDIIYLVTYDGRVVQLFDFELVQSRTVAAADDEGSSASVNRTTITFSSEQVKGIAVYQKKGAMDIAKSLIPDIIVAAVVILLIMIVVVIATAKAKKERRRRDYIRSLN